jgi:hypothetical protein
VGVVVDSNIQEEIERLEAQGNFALADLVTQRNGVSLAALAFQTSVPARFAALLANAPGFQALRARQEHRDRRDENDRAAKHAVSQRVIDRNMLRLRLGGEDIEISQGDMRKAMEARVTALEERRRQLLRNGQNPEEVERIENLVASYKPVINNLKTERASATTTAAIEDLAKRDSGLMAEVNAVKAEALRGAERRASFSAEQFSGSGIVAPVIKDVFGRAASPPVPLEVVLIPTSPLAPSSPKGQQDAKNTLQSLGL